MSLTEKVAYLKGVREGLDFSDEPMKEKFINGLLELLEEMSLTVNEIDEDLADAEDYIEEVDEALGCVEDFVYDDGCDCDCCDGDDEMYEVECPSCGEVIYLDEDMFDEEYIECPGCGEKLELDIDYDECDCGCDCCSEDDE